MTKLLTVLICNKNHAQYIARCLSSLSLQTLDKSLWSILWINNACTDNSEKILNRLIQDDDISDNKLPEIKVIIVPEKRGLAYVKNIGLRQIDTEYVAYQDVDDWSLPQRLEIQLSAMQNGVGGDMICPPYVSDICATQAWDIYPDNRLMTNCFSIGQYRYDHDIKLRLSAENILCHGSVMARKYALEAVGYYSEQAHVLGREDWHLWQRLASAGYKFYTVPERLYCYSLNTSVPR